MANAGNQESLDLLVSILDLEELELNLFRGRTPKEDRIRVFGGQVAGQALVAAGRTVAVGVVHSLHAYFLRPGDPSIPIVYQVDRIRADGTLPDSPLLHQCVVAYASDMTLMDTATLPHAVSWVDGRFQMASLDHAMWFHRPFRADEWLLYVQESPTASGGRGFTTGSLFRRDGTLVVSVAQEGLIRQRRA